jgi:dTDP-glucose 4,6-dehydratase
MKKSALVAGGAGFIGSHLCDLLLSHGYDVTAIDNMVTGRQSNLASQVRLLPHNIVEPLGLTEKFDEIYNLASPASPVDFAKMPIFIMDTASLGHRNLLELARRDGSRILFASTSEVYGDPLVHPQTESYYGNVNPAGPRSCYDEAKRFGEALSVSYLREHEVDIRIARIFNTYGPRMRPDDGRIIPNFFIQALQAESLTIYGEGAQTRSFCYVTDLAEGLFKLMQSTERTPVNIGNPTESTVLEIAQAVNSLTGNKVPVRYLPLSENDPKQRKPDITKAKALLQWEPRIRLEEGLQICHSYFKKELAIAGGHIAAPTL